MSDYRSPVPEIVGSLSYAADPEQEDVDRLNRRRLVCSVIRYAQERAIGAIGLIELVGAIGLDHELDELAGSSSAVRHLLIASAREADIPVPASDGT